MDEIESFLLENSMKLVDVSKLMPEQVIKILSDIEDRPHVFAVINHAYAREDTKTLFKIQGYSKEKHSSIIVMLWCGRLMMALPHEISPLYLSRWVGNLGDGKNPAVIECAVCLEDDITKDGGRRVLCPHCNVLYCVSCINRFEKCCFCMQILPPFDADTYIDVSGEGIEQAVHDYCNMYKLKPV